MANYNGSEKRKHPRLKANFVVSYRIKNLPADCDLSQTKNVSQGGILLTTNKLFSKGTSLAMTIRLPLITQKIEVTGLVVDSKEIVRDLIYETRIEFLDLDEDVMQELGQFIDEKPKNDK